MHLQLLLHYGLLSIQLRNVNRNGYTIAISLDNEEFNNYNGGMAYSTDARQMALNYHANGHTLEETSKELKVGMATLTRWKKQLSLTGNLEKAPLERQPRKFHDGEIRAYIQENPFATLKQIAEEFGGSMTGAYDALKRVNITLKKGLVRTQNEMKKSERSSVNNPSR